MDSFLMRSSELSREVLPTSVKALITLIEREKPQNSQHLERLYKQVEISTEDYYTLMSLITQKSRVTAVVVCGIMIKLEFVRCLGIRVISPRFTHTIM